MGLLIFFLPALLGAQFEPGQTLERFADFRSFASGDLDGDGTEDMAVGHRLGQFITLYLHRSSGFIPADTFQDTARVLDVALCDVQGDGVLDVVYAAGSGSTQSVDLRVRLRPGADLVTVASGITGWVDFLCGDFWSPAGETDLLLLRDGMLEAHTLDTFGLHPRLVYSQPEEFYAFLALDRNGDGWVDRVRIATPVGFDRVDLDSSGDTTGTGSDTLFVLTLHMVSLGVGPSGAPEWASPISGNGITTFQDQPQGVAWGPLVADSGITMASLEFSGDSFLDLVVWVRQSDGTGALQTFVREGSGGWIPGGQLDTFPMASSSVSLGTSSGALWMDAVDSLRVYRVGAVSADEGRPPGGNLQLIRQVPSSALLLTPDGRLIRARAGRLPPGLYWMIPADPGASLRRIVVGP